MKKENGKNPTIVLLSSKLFLASGIRGFRIFVEKYGEKKMLLVPFGLAFMGAVVFVLIPSLPIYIISLFSIGAGMAMLQVTINPLLRVSGGEEHFAFNSVIAQLFFGGASYLGPYLYSYLVVSLKHYSRGRNILLDLLSGVVPVNLSWISVYWVSAVLSLIMIIVIAQVRFPKLKFKEDERAGGWGSYLELVKNKYVILYFIGIFAYVGTEQGIGNWISEFLSQYHGLDPQTTGAETVAWFWGLLTLGCLLGLIFLKLFDSRKILLSAAVLAILCLTTAILSNGNIATIAFPLTGFFLSVMWSIIFSLALNSVAEHHGSFSGILCTGIIGGAIIPLIVGGLADIVGLRYGIMFLYISLAYILSIGIWAKPLIKNKTIFEKDNLS
ncbi:MAG: MFS transporter [Ignavibacteriaceae bacterium]